MNRKSGTGKAQSFAGSATPMSMKSETEVDIAAAESEQPKRPWVTPGFARLDLTNARAGSPMVNCDGASGAC
jgi:hypothetical protein